MHITKPPEDSCIDETILNPEPDRKLNECFKQLSLEAKELYLNRNVPVLETAPSALEFYREWVTPNKPVVIKDAVRNWPAIKKWNSPYLREQLGEKMVSVAVTPNGYADAPNGSYFVMPEERSMTIANFLNILDHPECHNGVFYIQKQNSNFTDEFSEILCDAAPDIPWFSEALGKQPDAINFWMGDERATTSMHKDHYENIYCVVSGHKDFILLPPTDAPWVPYKNYTAAIYHEETTGDFSIIMDRDTGIVPWISIDPLRPDLKKYPQYKHANPIHCRVNAGDALYLPSLWFHHVRQSHGCIAVNYWYDMEFDIKYNYYKFLQSLSWKENPL